MAEGTRDYGPNNQLKRIADSIDEVAAGLLVQSQAAVEALITEPSQIGNIVRNGDGPYLLPVGTRITPKWKATNGTVYDNPHIIVDYRDVTLKDGESVPAAIIKPVYASLDAIQFSQHQTIWKCTEALPAGTYHIVFGYNWGSNVVKDKSYQFTLTQQVPAGGRLIGLLRSPDTSPSTWTIKTYATAYLSSLIETVAVAEGSGGTSLGTFQTTVQGNLNSLQRSSYGYNRYSQSAQRQYLNSAALKGNWWTPQSDWDMEPDQHQNLNGYMAGWDQDFLDILSTVKVTTALNTVTDSGDGTQEDTWDKFWLPSLEEINCTPQLAGVEGSATLWYKRALGLSGFASRHPSVYDAYKNFALEAHSSAQSLRLRSASRGNAYHTWYEYSGGSVGSNGAFYAIRSQPFAAITGIKGT